MSSESDSCSKTDLVNKEELSGGTVDRTGDRTVDRTGGRTGGVGGGGKRRDQRRRDHSDHKQLSECTDSSSGGASKNNGERELLSATINLFENMLI